MSTSHYLEQYDAAADTDKSRLVRRWIDTEPLPFFKELREKRPILVTPKFTLVTRFDDVREVLNMPKVFTVAPYAPKMGDYLMMHDDDALHTREKSLMQCMLNRDDLPAVRTWWAKSPGIYSTMPMATSRWSTIIAAWCPPPWYENISGLPEPNGPI